MTGFDGDDFDADVFRKGLSFEACPGGAGWGAEDDDLVVALNRPVGGVTAGLLCEVDVLAADDVALAQVKGGVFAQVQVLAAAGQDKGFGFGRLELDHL